MKKIVLEQKKFGIPPPGVSDVEYIVVKLVGLITPRIGTVLQEYTVKAMLDRDFRDAPQADEVEII